uniref:Uncharacterized protein n=1 Tax=viral metagenome TaxID=1070528 RepID=A0A6C0KTH0_9ZZZZ
MDSLKGIISDVHTFLYGGMTTLPLTIAGTMLILGLFTANYAILFFLIGYLIGVPIVSTLLNFIVSLIFTPGVKYNIFGYLFGNPFEGMDSDICKVVQSSGKNVNAGKPIIQFASPWLSMVTFFLGYILTNALKLYSMTTIDGAITVKTEGSDVTNKVSNRKTQALIALISIAVFALAVMAFRMYTSCDSGLSVLLGAGAFGTAGYYWYQLLSLVGQDRLSDLFGIANRLLPPSAIENKPIACVPIPN